MDLLNILVCPPGLGPIVGFVKKIFGLIQIIVPICLIIVGAFDLAKAVVSSDEKEIKAATHKLIKRAIAAVAVFFLVSAASLIFGYASENDEQLSDFRWRECWDYDSDAYYYRR